MTPARWRTAPPTTTRSWHPPRPTGTGASRTSRSWFPPGSTLASSHRRPRSSFAGSTVDAPGPSLALGGAGTSPPAGGADERQRHVRVRAGRRQPPLLAAGAQRDSDGLERDRRRDHLQTRSRSSTARTSRSSPAAATTACTDRCWWDSRLQGWMGLGGGATSNVRGCGERYDDLRLRARRRQHGVCAADRERGAAGMDRARRPHHLRPGGGIRRVGGHRGSGAAAGGPCTVGT